MIRDFAEAATGIEPEVFDLCIVGTGAAGLCLAMQFASTQYRVAVLEAGGRDISAHDQAVYESEFPALPHAGAMTGRFRVFGGSTTRWGGQALPFNPIDFRPRDWVPHSGWPLEADAVTAYYPAAGKFMLVGEGGYAGEVGAALGAEMPALDPARFTCQFSKFSRQPDLRRIYEQPLRAATNITVLRGANLISLELTPTLDHVCEAVVSSPDLKRSRVQARIFILAAGGIENARLLLASNRQIPAGVGNERGLVGRFFQDHPGREIASVVSPHPENLQRLFNIYYRGGVRFKPRFSSSAEWQTRQRVLSVSGVLLFECGPNSAFALLRDSLREARHNKMNARVLQRLLRGLAKSGELWPTLYHRWRHHRHYNPQPQIRVFVSAEQEPDPESRVELSSTRRDRFDMPLSVVHWRLSELPARSIWHFLQALRRDFQRLGLGDVVADADLTENFADWKDSLRDNNHHIGTTRMGDSPANGVVDAQCRVHGIDNLFVAGSSVFPTGGHSNPTLTILALALRLADRLKQVL